MENYFSKKNPRFSEEERESQGHSTEIDWKEVLTVFGVTPEEPSKLRSMVIIKQPSGLLCT